MLSYNTTAATFFLLSLFLTRALAFTHTYIGGTLGASVATLNQNTPSIAYTSGALITDTYPLTHSYNTQPLLSLNAGYVFSSNANLPTIEIGAGIYTNLTHYRYQGNVAETAYGDPTSVLYNYNYQIDSQRLMAELALRGKLKQILPFINIGLGIAKNTLSHYQERALTKNGYVPLPGFQSTSSTNFAAQIGGGIRYPFSITHDKQKADLATIGYRFVFLGSNAFGTRGSSYPYRLATGGLNANEIYIGYTHLFMDKHEKSTLRT